MTCIPTFFLVARDRLRELFLPIARLLGVLQRTMTACLRWQNVTVHSWLEQTKTAQDAKASVSESSEPVFFSNFLDKKTVDIYICNMSFVTFSLAVIFTISPFSTSVFRVPKTVKVRQNTDREQNLRLDRILHLVTWQLFITIAYLTDRQVEAKATNSRCSRSSYSATRCESLVSPARCRIHRILLSAFESSSIVKLVAKADSALAHGWYIVMATIEVWSWKLSQRAVWLRDL